MDVKAKFRGDFAFLSNMYPCDIAYKGAIFPSAEHAYQLQKLPEGAFLRYEHMRMKPTEVKKFARTLAIPEDWESRKLQVMEEILTVKFSIPELKSRLLRTQDSDLVEENYWHDNFWGICGCAKCGGRGENHLGKILQNVKYEIALSIPMREIIDGETFGGGPLESCYTLDYAYFLMKKREKRDAENPQ